MNGFWDLERTNGRTDKSEFIGPKSALRGTKKLIWKTISIIIASKHVRKPDFESFLAIFTQHDPWKGPKLVQWARVTSKNIKKTIV